MSEAGIQFVGLGLAILMVLPDSNLSGPSTVLNWVLTLYLPPVSLEG